MDNSVEQRGMSLPGHFGRDVLVTVDPPLALGAVHAHTVVRSGHRAVRRSESVGLGSRPRPREVNRGSPDDGHLWLVDVAWHRRPSEPQFRSPNGGTTQSGLNLSYLSVEPAPGACASGSLVDGPGHLRSRDAHRPARRPTLPVRWATSRHPRFVVGCPVHGSAQGGSW